MLEQDKIVAQIIFVSLVTQHGSFFMCLSVLLRCVGEGGAEGGGGGMGPKQGHAVPRGECQDSGCHQAGLHGGRAEGERFSTFVLRMTAVVADDWRPIINLMGCCAYAATVQILDNPVLLTNTEPGRPTFRIQPEEKPAEGGGLLSWLC